MIRTIGSTLMVLFGLVLVGGCAAGPEAKSTVTTSSPPASPAATGATVAARTRPAGSPSAASPQATVLTGAKKAIDRAKQDLAKRQSIATDQIKVVSVTSVQWPTSALGCPQPGLMYSQVVTPGYRILLEAGGQTYEYHSDRDRRVVLCSTP